MNVKKYMLVSFGISTTTTTNDTNNADVGATVATAAVAIVHRSRVVERRQKR